MREFKFRAWDKKDSEMVSVDLIVFNDRTTTDKAHILDERNDVHYLNEIVLMQYTGLKDNNGVEIYEGDILLFALYDCYDKDTICNGTIVFSNCEFKLKIQFEDGSTQYDNLYYSYNANCGGVEVIGNIYENHELLNDRG